MERTMNDTELTACAESIARGDECTACGRTWDRAINVLMHRRDCQYLEATEHGREVR